jgi:hypothetical protein
MAWGSPVLTARSSCASSGWRTLALRARRATLAVAALTLAAPLLASSPIDIVWPGEHGVLHSGQQVEIRWRSLDADVAEAELLLIVDDDTGFTVRLTPEFEPGRESFTWVVPSLPASAARIRLRVGVDGEEVESEPSESFRIEADTGDPLPPIGFRNGEWWMGAVPRQSAASPEPRPPARLSTADTDRPAVDPALGTWVVALAGPAALRSLHRTETFPCPRRADGARFGRPQAAPLRE